MLPFPVDWLSRPRGGRRTSVIQCYTPGHRKTGCKSNEALWHAVGSHIEADSGTAVEAEMALPLTFLGESKRNCVKIAHTLHKFSSERRGALRESTAGLPKTHA